MRGLLILIVALLFSITVFAQQDSGFTNKAEAKNLMVDGKRDGKWLIYIDSNGTPTTDSTKAVTYALGIFNKGIATGICRGFYMNGKIQGELPYTNGKTNGVAKIYNKNGILVYEAHFIDDKKNGVVRWYYEDGKLKDDLNYINDTVNGIRRLYYENGQLKQESNYTMGKKNGIVKRYFENGMEKSEIMYTNDIKGEAKRYDSTGTEIKQ